jgi:exodeoxyribonuclease V alpha subunit
MVARKMMKKFERWKTLNSYLERGVFDFVDLVFASSVLKKINSDREEHAALLATLFALSRQGHLTLDLSKFAAECSILPTAEIEPLAEQLLLGAATFPVQAVSDMKNGDTHPNTWICRLGTYYYLQKNWIYESEILRHLERLNKCPPTLSLVCSTKDSHLNEEQRKGVENAMSHSLSLLTGGPGTGKTFTAAQLVKASLCSLPEEKGEQMRIILTAPTGKAVAQLEGNLRKVLNADTPIRAGTLHAILGVRTDNHEEEEMTPLLADLIIVDECSMIDAKMFSRLLSSVPSGARLVLIGDKDQLPPVEAGSIFADLLDANCYPSAHLTECLRSDRTEILTLSHHIKQGFADDALQLLMNNGCIAWTDLEECKETPDQMCKNLWERCKDHFTTSFLEKPLPEQILSKVGRFSLLSCMRQGPLGVDEVNRYFLYQSLKQAPRDAWWIAPIMITRNDYALELYNGDLGFLVRKVNSDFSLRQFHPDDYALFGDRKGGFRQIAALNLTSFEYSYCLSVHKSQGSEYDEVLILFPPGSESFGREVLYTAVTRARCKIFLFASKGLLKETIARSSRKKSGLGSRLKVG